MNNYFTEKEQAFQGNKNTGSDTELESAKANKEKYYINSKTGKPETKIKKKFRLWKESKETEKKKAKRIKLETKKEIQIWMKLIQNLYGDKISKGVIDDSYGNFLSDIESQIPKVKDLSSDIILVDIQEASGTIISKSSLKVKDITNIQGLYGMIQNQIMHMEKWDKQVEDSVRNNFLRTGYVTNLLKQYGPFFRNKDTGMPVIMEDWQVSDSIGKLKNPIITQP